MNRGDDGSLTVTAAELLSLKLCTGQCLLGLEGECQCRCQGRWHNNLAGAELIIPASLTLADALSGAGVLTGPRSPRPARTHRRRHRTRAGIEAEARAVLLSQPDISGAELGRSVGVSGRTGQRLLTRLTNEREPASTDDT